MQAKMIVAIAAVALAGVAQAQNQNQTAGDTARNAAHDAGAAAKAAVTPGDQNMGRNPDNRSGGMMGNDTNSTDTNATNGRRAARADRG